MNTAATRRDDPRGLCRSRLPALAGVTFIFQFMIRPGTGSVGEPPAASTASSASFRLMLIARIKDSTATGPLHRSGGNLALDAAPSFPPALFLKPALHPLDVFRLDLAAARPDRIRGVFEAHVAPAQQAADGHVHMPVVEFQLVQSPYLYPEMLARTGVREVRAGRARPGPPHESASAPQIRPR